MSELLFLIFIGSVFPDSTLDFFDTWTSDGSSALWMLVLTTCSLASRNIFEHKFHGLECLGRAGAELVLSLLPRPLLLFVFN
ncbi:unnamed protein product [Rhizophagus irregularis]|nr:unnamed protein product [Rhizophagus irregularis]